MTVPLNICYKIYKMELSTEKGETHFNGKQFQLDRQPQHTYKSLWQVIRMVAFYNISSFYFGYAVVYFNTMPYSTIHDLFNIPFEPAYGEGLLSGMISIGGIFGAIMVQPIIYFFSRKHSIYFVNFIALIGGVFVLILNPYTLIIGRLLQGFCAGAFSGLIPIMIKQLAPISIYGVMGGFQNGLFAIGTIVAFVFAYIMKRLDISSYNYWIYIFAFPFVTIILQQILFLTHYHNQTPKYLLIKGRSHQARQIIEDIYLPEHQNAVYHQLLKDLESDQTYEEDKEKEYPQDHWRAIFISIFLAFFLQLCGIHIVLIFGIQIGKGFMPNSSDELPIYLNVIQMIASIIGLYLLEKLTRRFLMVNVTAMICLSLLGLFVGFLIKNTNPQLATAIILISFVVNICSFVFSTTTVTWLYIPEVVQPRLVPVTTAIIWGMGGVITILFPIVRTACGDPDCPYVFLFLSFCMAIESVVCYFFLVETKDKTELQIREMFNSGKLQ